MTNKHYILYLKEHFSASERVSKLLELSGYNILTVSCDEQALALIHQHKPEVVLLDLTQPDSKGWTLFYAIKNDKSLAGVPIIDLGIRIPEGGRIILEEYLPPVPDFEQVLRSIKALAPKSRDIFVSNCV